MFCFKAFVSLCLILVISKGSLCQPKDMHHYRALFKEFKENYNKVYNSIKEHEDRFKIFVENLKKAEEIEKQEQGTAEYGVTRFADLSAAEFKQKYLGLNTKISDSRASPLPEAEIPDIEIPKNFDWRKKNVISVVKDQASCGSCWAFSTTGNIEGLWAIQKNASLSLSEQELLDCDTIDDACNGGLMTNAYSAIVSLGGLESETDYPYDAEQEKCKLKKKKVVATITGGVTISSNEKKMAKYLVKNGPISIGINADNMQLYKKGIAHPSRTACDPTYLDHGVLIVGYGVHGKTPYWIIKNSWGTTWGEKGYYRIYRGGGCCGLNAMVSSAVL